jgi:hypothetical protein
LAQIPRGACSFCARGNAVLPAEVSNFRALARAARRHRPCNPACQVHSMKANVVILDRTIRMGLGMLLAVSPILELKTYPFNLLGLVLIATAAVGYCPAYRLFSGLRPTRHASLPPAHAASGR